MPELKTYGWLLPACLALCGCRQPMTSIAQAGTDTVAGAALAEVGTMAAPRAAHTATTLADGTVLITGGMTGRGDAVAGAELYDPRSGHFSETGAMRTPRHSHTATRLADGRVLLAGGYDADGTYLASAELYDPATGVFTAAGTMQAARAGHVAVALADGSVLLAGGVGEGWTFLASAERFDPVTNAFSPTGAMAVARESHAAVRLDDGRVLVTGGHRGRREDIELYASTEVYDPRTGRFVPAVEMTVRRHKHDAVLLDDGRVLVTGGTDERDANGVYDSAEVLDLRGGTAVRTAPMQRPRYKHAGTSVTLADGRVLIAGGASEAEVFDPRTRSFTVVPGEARMAGRFAAVAPLADGRVLVTGGYGQDITPQAAVWLYRP